jgi:uncharacterized protein
MTAGYFAPLLALKVGGTELPVELAHMVTDVQISKGVNAADGLVVNLANPMPAMSWTHEEGRRGLFQLGVSVRVTLGYVDGPSEEVFDGEITRLQPTFPESGVPTVTVEALSRLHWLSRGKKATSYDDVTVSDVVERLASGLRTDVTSTTTRYPVLWQAGRSNLEMLRSLAEMTGYDFSVRGTTLRFGPRSRVARPRHRLVWGGARGLEDPGGPVLPLRSFTPTVHLRDQVKSVLVRSVHPVSGERLEGRATLSDVGAPPAGEVWGGDVAAQALSQPTEHVMIDVPVSSLEEATDRARAELRRRLRGLVTAQAATVGAPGLAPGGSVGVEGTGWFDGVYDITEVRHQLGMGGFLTQLHIEKGSLPEDGA